MCVPSYALKFENMHIREKYQNCFNHVSQYPGAKKNRFMHLKPMSNSLADTLSNTWRRWRGHDL
jgi:hypothetical protein